MSLIEPAGDIFNFSCCSAPKTWANLLPLCRIFCSADERGVKNPACALWPHYVCRMDGHSPDWQLSRNIFLFFYFFLRRGFLHNFQPPCCFNKPQLVQTPASCVIILLWELKLRREMDPLLFADQVGKINSRSSIRQMDCTCIALFYHCYVTPTCFTKGTK